MGSGGRPAGSALVRGAVLAGKYRLDLPLGHGGMAVVWRAHHLELQIPVAIKLLRAGHDARLAQRLKLEARAAARIAHPAIVRVLDVATTDDGAPFIVMELLSGETLADALARGNLSALRVVQLLLPIVEGLALVHDHGVVHRDLKPENVLLATEGERLQPKLLDFGIARLAGGGPVVRLTENGMTLGSPSYMSPEQALGEPVDHRSDIWSFCVLLYKAIGGKSPFRGATPRDIIDAILEQEPPDLPLGAGVDGHLARIVLSGLNKDPSARPASMRLLGQQLARWLLLHGVSADACGTPVVARWLSSEPPTKPRASMHPLAPRPLPRSSPDNANERTTRELARAEPARPSIKKAVARDSRRTMPHHRRWMLWALAGVLLAGGSLALTRPRGTAAANEPAAQRLASQAAAEQRVSTNDDSGSLEPSSSEPPVAPASPTVTAERAAITEPARPRTPPITGSAAQPAKTATPTPRPTLPF